MQNQQSELSYSALLSPAWNHLWGAMSLWQVSVRLQCHQPDPSSPMSRTPNSALWCFLVPQNAAGYVLSPSAVWSGKQHAAGLWTAGAGLGLLQRGLDSIVWSSLTGLHVCHLCFKLKDVDVICMKDIFFSENSLPPLPGQTSAMGKLWFFILFFTWAGYFQKSSLFSLSFFSENMG